MTWLRMTGDAETSFESDMRRGSLEPAGASLRGERIADEGLKIDYRSSPRRMGFLTVTNY